MVEIEWHDMLEEGKGKGAKKKMERKGSILKYILLREGDKFSKTMIIKSSIHVYFNLKFFCISFL